MSIKIFSIYHKDAEILKSDVIEPIQTGCNFSDLDLGILKDNTGENIADKNPYYGEMTAWYWVWKNYLKENPTLEYIGFCHYRRFLDFKKKENYRPFMNRISAKIFKKKLAKDFSEAEIYKRIKNYDIILPAKVELKKKDGSIYEHFIKNHPEKEIEKFLSVLYENYPEYRQDCENFLHGKEAYFCLNFVMKRELFIEFMEWTFNLLEKMEQISDWSQYKNYLDIRTPAYLMERFINVWINYKIRVDKIRVLERKSLLILKEQIKILPYVNIFKNEGQTILDVFGIKIALKHK